MHFSSYPPGHVPADFRMDDLKCNGTETNIRHCDHHKCDDCGSGEGAGVVCEGDKSS